VLEVTIRINGTNHGVTVDRKPWEEVAFLPRYPSTSYIGQIKPWVQARDKILPKFEDDLRF